MAQASRVRFSQLLHCLGTAEAVQPEKASLDVLVHLPVAQALWSGLVKELDLRSKHWNVAVAASARGAFQGTVGLCVPELNSIANCSK